VGAAAGLTAYGGNKSYEMIFFLFLRTPRHTLCFILMGGANPMNQIQTVGTVSKSLCVSSRTIRYYEQIGLIKSQRLEDYAYRVYDENIVARLRQIIVLRKLRVPVKQIRKIFESSDATSVIEIFERNINELDDEITALATLKTILSNLVQELSEKANVQLQLDLLSDNSIFTIVDSISLPKNILQEEKNMSDLNKAVETLGRLKDEEVRIVYLPPATVLSHHVMGDEGPYDPMLGDFERELAKIKPDFRHYGYDHNMGDEPGYERLVTIPDDMEVSPPFTKRHFPGGMFAACVLPVYDYDKGWGRLIQWAATSEKYEHVADAQCLEEHNSAAMIITGADEYIDLLLPIKLR
jgi:DNA-binding transcriptional MerR regulator